MKFGVSLVAALFLVACANSGDYPGNASQPEHDAAVCTDSDGDGFGDGCSAGGDCNDEDPTIQRGCLNCARPAEGCACDSSNKPVSCFLDPSSEPDGVVMCHEGTRYCRGGEWTGCESIYSYPKPEQTQQAQAVISPDAGQSKCSDCRPNCFIVRDNLDPSAAIDGSANQTTLTDAGGLTLGTYIPDAGMDAAPYDASGCVLNTSPDMDCDGIPDLYDPYPTTKPFQTTNPAIFLDLAPGKTGTGNIDLKFTLNSADIYLLVDQTGSMEAERVQLQTDLTTGNFVNSAAYQCSDFDSDGLPNNEQKTKGIVGAIRCYIRDANFGVGYFREIPFLGYADNQAADAKQMIAYRNLQDITGTIDSVIAGVGKLGTVLNLSWPEDTTVALNSVVTGNGMYFGVDRPSVPTRSTCPVGTWGYPCFRNEAIPIIMLFTDAPMHNGPTNNSDAYNASACPPEALFSGCSLSMTAGTSTTMTEIASTNETFSSVVDLGDLTSKYLTFGGNTTGMSSNLSAASMTCDSNSTPFSPDAFFKFNLTSTKTITITTEGSSFDTVLGFWGASPASPTALTAPNTNDNASPYAFGSAYNKWATASGSTSGLASDYAANDVSCGAYPGSADATFTFTLPMSTKVAIDTLNSGFGTSIGLFSSAPPALPTYTAVTGNDAITAPYVVTPTNINGQNKGFSGDTSQGAITANYAAASLGSCGGADASPDAVYQFSVGSNTRVRIAAESSTLDTIVSLLDNNTIPSWSAATGNEAQGTAKDLGALDGKALRLTGSTASMAAEIPGATAGCSAVDAGKDAVFKFNLASPKSVKLDTAGSSFDTVLSLFKDSVTTAVTSLNQASQTNEIGTSATSLGGINGKKFVVTGGTTAAMTADYSATQVGCGPAGTTGASPDAVFKFNVATSTKVKIDTSGSTYNTVLSLHTALPDPTVTTLASNVNEAIASPQVMGTVTNKHVRYDGTTTSMGADITVNDGLGCDAADDSRDAVYKFSVTTAGTYELSTGGSSFDTVLGLFPSSPAPAFLRTYQSTTAKASQGDLKTAPVDVGPLDNKWLSFTGSTSSLGSESTNPGCGASNGGRDGWYKFTLSAPKTVRIDTVGSGFNTVLALYSGNTGGMFVSCDNSSSSDGDDLIEGVQLAAGTYFVMLSSTAGSENGNYRLTFRDVTATSNMLQCDDDGVATNGASKLTRSLAVGDYYAVVKGKTSTSRGAYKFAVKHVEFVNPASRVTCNDDISGTDNKSSIEQTLAAGDYYVVVKGTSSTEKNSYTLTVQDTGNPPTSGFVDCNDNAPALTTSTLTKANLPAGNYYVVVKGKASGNSGNYILNLQDTAVTLATPLQCDANSGANSTSLVERDLTAGTYRVVVKGAAAADKGLYRLQLRDVTALPSNRLYCDNDSGGGNKSSLEQTLAAGTYTVVLKGDNASGSGAYKLTVRDSTNIVTTDTVAACDNDTGADNTSKLSGSLAAGTYYVGVKGYSTNDYGQYQLNIGAGATSTQTYVPPTWATTKANLKAKKARVMTVLSCRDDPLHGNLQGDCNTARAEAKDLATQTDTLNPALQPLVFDIDGDGGGLSKSVVDGVIALANYLEMNVKVQVVFDPDANPGFAVVVKAIDAAGDGCDGIVGVEHQKCKPGSTPHFTVEFTNPLGSPVPLNSLAKDPKGGYNFRAELIANNTFVVDKVPIYIIPANVTNVPPPPQVYPNGTYWQNLAATGCAMGGSTYLPDWNELTWNAIVPNGTNVTFAGCTAANAAALATCTPVLFATITGGAACTTDGQCSATGGYCSVNGNCNTITAGSCTTDANCGLGASCLANKCVYGGQPVYVGSALGSQNYSSNLRVRISLAGNTGANVGPTVNDWSINYVCKSSL